MQEIIVPPMTQMPDEVIKAYCAKHKCNPIDAFSDILSDRMFKKIEQMDYAPVLRILTENVIGKGLKT